MNVLKEYQKINGLKVDGIIGKEVLTFVKNELKITNINRLAHFMGQLHHESRGFKARRESMNYSTIGLKNTFRFFRKNVALALRFGRNKNHPAMQQAIANTVYNDANRSNRYKLGNTEKGDGWKYRGGFGIQTTGRSNYTRLAKILDDPMILDSPDDVIEKYYFLAGKVFFDDNSIWGMCDLGINISAISRVTKRINGGLNGLEDRIEWTKYYHSLLVKNNVFS